MEVKVFVIYHMHDANQAKNIVINSLSYDDEEFQSWESTAGPYSCIIRVLSLLNICQNARGVWKYFRLP